MRRIILVVGVLGLVINTSCKKCKTCHYTYSTSEIIQTPNGEETVVTNDIVGYVINDDGETLREECIKGDESFTIVTEYESEEATSTLSDFTIVCEDV